MPGQLGHEGLAEAHDLGVGPPVRVEVAPALAAADTLGGQSVLEDLLEAEELDDAGVDARVEAQTALVGSQSRVELDPEAALDVDLTRVIDPRDAEDDLALRLDEALEERSLGVGGVLGDDRLQGLQNLADRLVELGLAAVAVDDPLVDLLDNALHGNSFTPYRARRTVASARRASPSPGNPVTAPETETKHLIL